jgi:hypothetical protein
VYEIKVFTGAEILDALKRKTADFSNMAIEKGVLDTCNGTMDRYTMMDDAIGMLTPAKAVIIDRVESNNVLTGFTIFNASGVLESVDVAQAIAIGRNIGFSNAKVVNNTTISSIRGAFPLKSIVVEKSGQKKKSVPELDLFFISTVHKKGHNSVAYAGVMIHYSNADEMRQVYPKLTRSNTVMKKDIQTLAPGMDITNLAITRGPNAGIYATVKYETLKELLALAKGRFKATAGSVAITYIDASNDPSGVERMVTMTPELAIKGNSDDRGTAKAAEIAKSVAATIKELRA